MDLREKCFWIGGVGAAVFWGASLRQHGWSPNRKGLIEKGLHGEWPGAELKGEKFFFGGFVHLLFCEGRADRHLPSGGVRWRPMFIDVEVLADVLGRQDPTIRQEEFFREGRKSAESAEKNHRKIRFDQ